MKMKTIQTILLGLAFTCSLSTGAFGATFVQTTPYLSALDSPFNTALSGYYIEDFEDGSLNTTGAFIMSTAHGSSISAGFSVDADDGSIDGSGAGGKSLSVITQFGTTGVTFIFNAGTLGQLPQAVGIVATHANAAPLVIETFDPVGVSHGTTNVTLSMSGATTGDDVFLGVTDLGGISKFKLSSNAAATFLHLDHLQYGPVPEPATLSLLGIGAWGILRRRRRPNC
ncbi:MAG: PEP-CTERM sorting domain-containing protein [Phycisphaerae bacterium]|jgi:hypothetical protein|nr:PEP-CTERM sorting domain-containing protein [Phycisphaerae bacterium]